MGNKQIHVRLDDVVYEELAEYAKYSGQTVQECISFALMDLFEQQKQKRSLKSGDFTFIDLFAGIGGIRLGFGRMKRLVDIVFIPMNGINTASGHIFPILEKCRMVI